MLVQEISIDGKRTIIAPLSGRSDRWLYFAGKRLLDVVLATSLLVFLTPLMLLIAALIKLDSPGPIIFVQQRVGAKRQREAGHIVWHVQSFPFYKFRTMVRDADQSVHEAYIKAWTEGCVEEASNAGAKFKLANDARVTRVGRFLRRTSLDELPQLVNVVKGEMSLVGPRPVPTYEVAQYQSSHWERLAALPGITGRWQVTGRCRVSFDEMIRMDIEYVRHRSLWLDMKLLFLTIPAVLSGKGAA